MRPALSTPLTALALTSSLLTGCGADDAPDVVPDVALEAPASAAPSASTAASASAPPGGSPSAAAPSQVAGPEPATSAAPPADAPAAVATRTAAPAAPTAARSAAAVSRATADGTYTYDARGTATLGGAAPQSRSGTATLRVDAPEGDRQSAVLSGDQGRTETDGVLRADGRYLARLLLTTPAFSKEFRPSTPVLLLPEPLAVGRTWSFTLRSTDGKTTATARNRVVRAEPVTVGGERLDTRVVQTALTLRGDVVYDGTTTTHYAPSVRLAVREQGSGKGSVGGVPFSTRSSSTLRSTEPA